MLGELKPTAPKGGEGPFGSSPWDVTPPSPSCPALLLPQHLRVVSSCAGSNRGPLETAPPLLEILCKKLNLTSARNPIHRPSTTRCQEKQRPSHQNPRAP